jgi:hypothetical protein
MASERGLLKSATREMTVHICFPRSRDEQQTRPNIVFIISGDIGWMQHVNDAAIEHFLEGRAAQMLLSRYSHSTNGHDSLN